MLHCITWQLVTTFRSSVVLSSSGLSSPRTQHLTTNDLSVRNTAAVFSQYETQKTFRSSPKIFTGNTKPSIHNNWLHIQGCYTKAIDRLNHYTLNVIQVFCRCTLRWVSPMMVLVYTYSQDVYMFMVNISPQGNLTRYETDYEALGQGTITKRQGRAQFLQASIHNNCKQC